MTIFGQHNFHTMAFEWFQKLFIFFFQTFDFAIDQNFIERIARGNFIGLSIENHLDGLIPIHIFIDVEEVVPTAADQYGTGGVFFYECNQSLSSTGNDQVQFLIWISEKILRGLSIEGQERDPVLFQSILF